MPETETYTAELAALEEKRDDAQWRAREAREAARTARSGRVREVTADLAEFHNQINFRKPEATAPEKRAERERDLTDALIDSIRENGLTLVPASSGGGAPVLLLHDPTVDEEQRAAEAEVNDLDRDIALFVKAHAADLEAERRKAEADSIREALAGDDPDAMRDAIAGGRPGSGVFTTDDLGRPVVHRRSPVLGR